MYWCNVQLCSGNMHTCASRITVPTLSLFHLSVFRLGRGAGSHTKLANAVNQPPSSCRCISLEIPAMTLAAASKGI